MKEYPRIAELGVTVHREPVAHVKNEELNKALGDRKKEFGRLFGIQTCLIDGPYAWDVEAVLERMASGKLTGTQLEPD